MAYVDGFVLPIPAKNVDAYKRMARKASKVWKDHGALEYVECVYDGLHIKGMQTFPRGIKVKRGETVIMAWITYKSRAHRDKVMAKVMADPRLADMPNPMPFDSERMLYGGFKTLVSF